jgi:flavin-dependent dehydrogenase
MKKYLIIGGGVAGLAAACRLIEKGEKPLILEAGSYPSHKICGEFFSPECVAWLKRWGITFEQEIHQITLRSGQRTFTYPLLQPAGSMSHLSFDSKLLNRALEGGAEIWPNTPVLDILPTAEGFLVTVSQGQKIEVKNLIVAVGKLPFFRKTALKPTYYGIKAYFSHLPVKEKVVMFSLPGSYLGVSEVEKGIFNVACLTQHPFAFAGELIEKIKKEDAYLNDLFNEGKMLFSDWMVASIPEFGLKATPSWNRAYFIGDASITIPPASGAGLSIALASGILAADYAKDGNPEGFKKAWKKSHLLQLKAASLLHHLMLRPKLLQLAMRASPFLPGLTNFSFRSTRERYFSGHLGSY